MADLAIATRTDSLSESYVRSMAWLMIEGNFHHRTYWPELARYGWCMPVAEVNALEGKGKTKACYQNCGQITVYHHFSPYLYCEGVAISRIAGVPLEHAWLLDTRDGKVHDPTWPDGCEYFGVAWQPEAQRTVLVELGLWGLLPCLADYTELPDSLSDWRTACAGWFVGPDDWPKYAP